MKGPLIGLGLSAVCLILSFTFCGNAHSSSDGMLVFGLVMLASGIIGGVFSLIWLIVALIRDNK